jgi:hypothetical protein
LKTFQILWKENSRLDSEILPSDLLNIGLHLPSISQQCIINCLHQIAQENIHHKESTECISLILIYYKNLFLKSLSSSTSSMESVDDFTQALCEICHFCFEIIESEEVHQSSSTLILELFPSMVQLLSQPSGTCKSFFGLHGGSSGSGGGGIDSSRHQRGPQVILDCFFAIKWPHCYLVFLCNIVTEIWEYLYPRHRVLLKVQGTLDLTPLIQPLSVSLSLFLAGENSGSLLQQFREYWSQSLTTCPQESSCSG